jgi:hypothetical protein
MPARTSLPAWTGGPLPDRRHERFIVLVVVDGLDPHVAYTKAGFKSTSEASARANSSRLINTDIIRYRRRELETEIANRTVQKRVDDCVEALDARAEALRDLRRCRDLAFEQKKAGEASECIKKICILEGVWIEQTATVATVSDLRTADDSKLLSVLFGHQQIIAPDQRQRALASLLERRRQVIEAKPAEPES